MRWLWWMTLLVLPIAVGCDDGAPTEPQDFMVEGRVALASLMALSDGHLLTIADHCQILASTEEARSADWERIRGPLGSVENLNVRALMWFALPDGSYWSVQGGSAAGLQPNQIFFSIDATPIGALQDDPDEIFLDPFDLDEPELERAITEMLTREEGVVNLLPRRASDGSVPQIGRDRLVVSIRARVELTLTKLWRGAGYSEAGASATAATAISTIGRSEWMRVFLRGPALLAMSRAPVG